MSRRHGDLGYPVSGRPDPSADAGHRRPRCLVRHRFACGTIADALADRPAANRRGCPVAGGAHGIDGAGAGGLAEASSSAARSSHRPPFPGSILLVLNVSEPIGSPWRPCSGRSSPRSSACSSSPWWQATPRSGGRRRSSGDGGLLPSWPAAAPAWRRSGARADCARQCCWAALIVATSPTRPPWGSPLLVIPGLTALSLADRHGEALAGGATSRDRHHLRGAGRDVLARHPQGLELPLSRSEMIQVALEALRADPMLLLHGAGWGSYNDILYRFLDHVRDVRVESEDLAAQPGHHGRRRLPHS